MYVKEQIINGENSRRGMAKLFNLALLKLILKSRKLDDSLTGWYCPLWIPTILSVIVSLSKTLVSLAQYTVKCLVILSLMQCCAFNSTFQSPKDLLTVSWSPKKSRFFCCMYGALILTPFRCLLLLLTTALHSHWDIQKLCKPEHCLCLQDGGLFFELI